MFFSKKSSVCKHIKKPNIFIAEILFQLLDVHIALTTHKWSKVYFIADEKYRILLLDTFA